MFMKTILALSFAILALAAPSPQDPDMDINVCNDGLDATIETFLVGMMVVPSTAEFIPSTDLQGHYPHGAITIIAQGSTVHLLFYVLYVPVGHLFSDIFIVRTNNNGELKRADRT
ncbi:hypothetical protein BGW80DRAFT_1258287 [Lactifluus volemus]|nr:hypothetical protein BGW80DRAFT_1258287 [Lactifluus volemus]